MPTYINFRPGPHTLAQSFETHLQCRHLVRFAEIGLEAHGYVFPRQVFLFLELEEKLLFFVQLNRACLRRGTLSLSLAVLGVFFVLSHAFKGLHLSETNRIWGYWHWSVPAWRRARVWC